MFRKNYYCLVAGLKDYARDTDTKGFDAPAIIEEIKSGVSARDRRAVELLYTYYDICNIASMRGGRDNFSQLGNFSREELTTELDAPSHLPPYITQVLAAYDAAAKAGDGVPEDDGAVDVSASVERSLFAAYYGECARSHSKFLREWSDFDRTLRNVASAFAARRRGMPAGEYLVGSGDIESALAHSSAADFGLKGEVEYVDNVMTAVSGDMDVMEKERKMDDIRWNMACSLTEQNYFDVDFLLGYLVRINIIHRWAALDVQYGREMLHRLVESFSEKGSATGL